MGSDIQSGTQGPNFAKATGRASQPGRSYAGDLGGNPAGKGPYGDRRMSPGEVSAASFLGNTAKQVYDQGDDGKEQEQMD
jgi:hypothetical protein